MDGEAVLKARVIYNNQLVPGTGEVNHYLPRTSHECAGRQYIN